MRTLLVGIVAVTLTLAACGGGEPSGGDAAAEDESQNAEAGSDAFPREEVTVAAGDTPPTVDDVGLADEIDPRDRETLDLDLATLGSTWNDAAEEMDLSDIVIDEFRVGYARPTADYTHEFVPETTAWLTLFGTISYDTDEVEYAGVEWEYDPEIDGEQVMGAVLVLLATVVGSPDDALDALDDLGLANITEDALAEGIDETVVYDDVEVELWSDDFGGDLVARPAP